MARTLRTGLLASVLVVLLAACDPFGGQGQGGGGEGQQQQTTRSQATTQQASGDTEPVGGQAPARSGTPVATQEVQNDGATLRIDITGLKRNNQLTTLSWNITVIKGAGDDGTWGPNTDMGANQTVDYDTSGVTLLDTVNSKRYLVARSGASGEDEGDCVCSNNPSGAYLHTGEAVSFFATFTSPPPDITKVNVDLVALGVFNEVPIS